MADLFCCLQVNDELKLRRLLYGKIGWLGSLEDLVYVVGGFPEQIIEVRAIRHKPALIDELLLEINSRQSVFRGKLDDPLSFGEKRRGGHRHNRFDLLLLCGFKGAL